MQVIMTTTRDGGAALGMLNSGTTYDLPFDVTKSYVDFYIGWRPYGAFGVKLKNGDR